MSAVHQLLVVLRRNQAVGLMLAACLALIGEPVAAESRGLRVALPSVDGADGGSPSEILYTDSYALVIGIDHYTGGWPVLSNAVKDAEEVALALDARGFDVELRTDLDNASLERVIKGFFVRKGANPSARLLLWYAGHGHTIGGEGFLVPTDAPLGEDPEFKLAALHMRDFGSWVRLAESKHVLAIFDSCFSGTIFASTRSRPPAAISRAIAYPVRQFLTSGDADQQVSDDGTFRELFVDALRGRESADLNGDGYITASELGMLLSDRVTNLTAGMQTPRYGKLRDKKFDRGDFVLSARPTDPAPPLADPLGEPDESRHQSVFWESIRNSDEPQDYQAYLDEYPRGAFASLARIKLDRLDPAASEPVPHPLTTRDEQRWATTDANVRASPSADAARIAGVSQGAAIQVTGEVLVNRDPWYRVRLATDQQGFILGRLLATARPPIEVEPQPVEPTAADNPPSDYGQRIDAARGSRRVTQDDKIADLYQQAEIRSLKRDKCQQTCASISFRSQVERQREWPTARDRCNNALPNHQAYNQCVEQQRSQFEQRLQSECRRTC